MDEHLRKIELLQANEAELLTKRVVLSKLSTDRSKKRLAMMVYGEERMQNALYSIERPQRQKQLVEKLLKTLLSLVIPPQRKPKKGQVFTLYRGVSMNSKLPIFQQI